MISMYNFWDTSMYLQVPGIGLLWAEILELVFLMLLALKIDCYDFRTHDATVMWGCVQSE